MVAKSDPNTTLELCRDFEAGREVVFDTFLDANALQTIWTADDYTITTMTVDARVGGSWSLAMRDEATGAVSHVQGQRPGTYSYFCSIHPKMTGKVLLSRWPHESF